VRGAVSGATIASDPVAPWHFCTGRRDASPCPICPGARTYWAPANDAIREIAKALRPHIDAATLEKIVNELLDVPGNRSFRDAIEELARELDSALMSGVQHHSPKMGRGVLGTFRRSDRSVCAPQSRLRAESSHQHRRGHGRNTASAVSAPAG
jgi:hypothetical protein